MVEGFKLLFKGFRLGLLLQLAIGPVCLYALNASFAVGFLPSLAFVAAVTLADAFYIALAILGVSSFLKKKRIRLAAIWAGGGMLLLFGADMVLSALNVPFIPNINLFHTSGASSLFMQGLLLTLSNPLTILFWSGVLTARISQMSLNTHQRCLYAAGCVLATFIFLTAVVATGGVLQGHVPALFITVLNIVVGVAIIGFGIRLLFQKKD